MESRDVVILGAGAAGLFCAGSLAGQGLDVLVIDHAPRPGEKIRISGGGRANFTNLATAPDRFHSQNQRFAASALAGFTPRDFVRLVDRAGIAWHEKTAGQLFCDGKATQITAMLLDRMEAELRLGTPVEGVARSGAGFIVTAGGRGIAARRVVLATGGKSIPKMGATGIGYRIAADLGLRVTETRPGLVPLTFAAQDLDLCRPLAGLATEAAVTAGRATFRDGLLFTHRGLSGPAILQASSLWQPGDAVRLDLAPGGDAAALLRAAREATPKRSPATALGALLPDRLAAAVVADCALGESRLGSLGNAAVERLAARVHRWTLRPVGSEGYRTAEVTVGGIDTRDLHARSLEARAVPGLHVIGELVDVTGWLGGYNFQWAWASGHAAARAILAG